MQPSQIMLATNRPQDATVVRSSFNLPGQTASSGHPSPTDSDPKASSDSTGLPDTHSESSDVSPTSPQSDRAASNGSGSHHRPTDISNDTPQDLSLKHRKGSSNQNDVSFENGDPLGLKCQDCGCLFASEPLLKMHIQETHNQQSENGLSAYQRYANGAGLQYDPAAVLSFRDPRLDESAAVASLLSLQQLQGQMTGDGNASFDAMARNTVIKSGANLNGPMGANGTSVVGEKIFNREAYCDICNKEFCNKYYLQTHKATKHNIPAVPSKIGLSRSSLGSLEDMDVQVLAAVGPREIAAPKAQLPASATRADDGASELRCPFCGQQCANPYQLQSHVITLHPNQAQTASMLGNQAAALQAMYAAQLMGATNPAAFATAPNPFGSALDRMKLLAATGLLPPTSGSPGTGSPALNFGAMPTSGATNPLEAFLQSQSSVAGPAAFGLTPFSPAEFGSLTSGLPVVSSAAPGFAAVQTGTTPVGSSVGSTASVGSKEAYCEICRKEFCNKYFLRTHKLKKHGIASEDSPTHLEGSLKRSRSALDDGALPTMVSWNGPSFPSQDSTDFQPPEQKRSPLSEALQKPPVSLVVSSSRSGVISSSGMSDGQITPREDSVKFEDGIYTSTGLSLDKLLASSQENPSPTLRNSTNSTQSLFCNICSRSFNSVFGLVAHKYRDHGGAGLDTTPLPATVGGGPKLQSTPHKENEPPLLQAVDPEAYCELCQKEFCSKYFLKTHRMNIHGISEGGDTPPSGMQNGSATGSLASSPSKVSATINAVLESAIGNGSSSPSSHGSPTLLGRRDSTPGSASGRPRYVTGKNFCDICNKEVCNKYFLRTHMLKMHGIVIDENKTIIGNINTVDKEKLGNLVFRCDICHKELSSRHFLKIHKINVHGISAENAGNSPGPTASIDNGMPLSMPPNVTVSTNGGPPNSTFSESPDGGMDPQDLCGNSNVDTYKEVCPMCDRRFKSLNWLQTHILTDHKIGLTDSDRSESNSGYQTPSFVVKTESAETEVKIEPELNTTTNCEYCSMTFDDVIQLQLHIIGQHAMEVHGRAKSLAEQTALHAFFPQQPTEATFSAETAPLAEKTETTGNPSVKSSPPMVVKHNGTKLYRCSYCHYYTKWLSNLSVHERRHTGEAPKEEKPYVCNICLRAYRYAHSLERHKEVHKYSSNASLQFFNQKSPEKSANLSLDESLESTPGSEATGAALEYGTASQKQATGAKRFRCTKCMKVFKSRELCRSHLFAVHRRQEVYRPDQLMSSPSKCAEDMKKCQESPNSCNAAVRSVLNQITSQVSGTKGADPITQVVEAVHTQKEAPISMTDDEFSTLGNGNMETSPRAFAVPDTLSAKHGQPYMIQEFKMSLSGIQGQNNGGRTPFFEDMTVYLPVFKRVQEEVDILKVSLKPAENLDNIFSV